VVTFRIELSEAEKADALLVFVCKGKTSKYKISLSQNVEKEFYE